MNVATKKQISVSLSQRDYRVLELEAGDRGIATVPLIREMLETGGLVQLRVKWKSQTIHLSSFSPDVKNKKSYGESTANGRLLTMYNDKGSA